jgi:hypothetical protein
VLRFSLTNILLLKITGIKYDNKSVILRLSYAIYNKYYMKNVRHLLSGIAIFLLASCASSVSSVNALQNNAPAKPTWVSSKPVSGRYYVGIGYSQKDRNDNFLQSAKQNALDDMISEIRVQISSVSVLNQLDDNEGFSELYESMIKTTASAEIEDYELIDTWEDGGQYWVYYRLSKEKYRKQQAEKRKNAIDLATDNYVNANNQIAAGEVSSALTLYINGLYTMAPYLGESNKTVVDGDSILLGNALYDKIQGTFNGLSITTDQEQYTINRRLSKDKTINVALRTKSTNKVVGGFPLKARFSAGAGVISPSFTTGGSGQAQMLLSSITSKAAKQSIAITTDIDLLIPQHVDAQQVGLLLSGLQLPQKELYFQIQKPVVYLESVEKMLGTPAGGLQLSNKIKQILSEEGFSLGRIKDKADLWIEVVADTQEGKSSGSIFVTYFDLNIYVIDQQSGVEIHHAGINRLKAYSLNYERSSQSGYEKALEVLENETMPQLIAEILQ